MRLQHTHPAAGRRRRFSLVELLTVMLIVGILLAVAIPAAIRVTSGSSVEAAARMVGAQLRLARQEAIARRRNVAVLFPRVMGAGIPPETIYRGYRACYVDRSSPPVWLGWVENTSWAYVPVGSVVAEVDDDNFIQWSASNPSQPTPGTETSVANIEGNVAVSCRAVVFRPTGRLLDAAQRAVTVVEAGVPEGGTTVVPRNRQNWIEVRVNQYTGRATFVRPEG